VPDKMFALYAIAANHHGNGRHAAVGSAGHG
jgi:hypothetical protein